MRRIWEHDEILWGGPGPEIGNRLGWLDIADRRLEDIDDLVALTGASRSIVREAVRVLVALGLLSARRRVGVTVLGVREWDVLDPRVVRWRLRGPDGDRVAVELRELRAAVVTLVELQRERDAAAGLGVAEHTVLPLFGKADGGEQLEARVGVELERLQGRRVERSRRFAAAVVDRRVAEPADRRLYERVPVDHR